ncbi:FHA domain protein (fragment) [Candidatus Desulfosporosinus infrequens]|uniref:FHA domain protein n=1 Tax=Candidatus Desulfosporosinus infrequens TaxID=2043169 RepID=A0A2U3KSX9_9FIRM
MILEEGRNEEGRNEERETVDEPDWRESTTIFKACVKPNLVDQGLKGRNSEYFLEIIEGPDIGQSFSLQDAEVFIGRHGQCELVLHDPEVSRRHLKIALEENSLWLDDLGSTNGSFVNGQRITHLSVLPGDRIQIGQSVLVIQRSPLACI